jgi:hypothetical protein
MIAELKGYSMEIVKEDDGFIQLTKAIVAGWEIEEPVLLGAMWRSSEKEGAYHFVLKNKVENKTTLLSLSPSPQLLTFLAENNISVSTL